MIIEITPNITKIIDTISISFFASNKNKTFKNVIIASRPTDALRTIHHTRLIFNVYFSLISSIPHTNLGKLTHTKTISKSMNISKSVGVNAMISVRIP